MYEIGGYYVCRGLIGQKLAAQIEHIIFFKLAYELFEQWDTYYLVVVKKLLGMIMLNVDYIHVVLDSLYLNIVKY